MESGPLSATGRMCAAWTSARPPPLIRRKPGHRTGGVVGRLDGAGEGGVAHGAAHDTLDDRSLERAGRWIEEHGVGNEPGIGGRLR